MGIGPRKSAHNKTKGKVILRGIMIIMIRIVMMRNIAFNCILSCKKVNLNPLTPSKGAMGPKTPKGKLF
jgi:hypothetical protein